MPEKPILVVATAVVGLMMSLSLAVPSAHAAAPPTTPTIQVGAGAPIPGGRQGRVVGDTGWQGVLPSFEISTCGIIYGGIKDINRPGTRQQRTVSFANGDVVTLLRGSATLSVGMLSDGWPDPPVYPPPIDVVIGGWSVRVDYASGAVFVNRTAPGLLAENYDPIGAAAGFYPEGRALVRVGLPVLAVSKKGSLTYYTNASKTHTTILRKPSVVQDDLCETVGFGPSIDGHVYIYSSAGI